MLDINKIVGLIFNFNKRKNLNEIRNRLIEISPNFDKDDLLIFDSKVGKGSGEITSLLANYVASEPLRCLRDTIKTIGQLDCVCPKIVFVAGDSFDEDFKFHFQKMLRLSESHSYEIKFFVLDFSNSLELDVPKISIDEMVKMFKESSCQI